MNAVLQPKAAPAVIYSKSAIERAGEVLIVPDISNKDPQRLNDALNALSYWRTCHLVPLDTAVRELEAVVRFRHKSAIVAKRLKRAPSIITKLRRFPEMKLQNMQDIGGCRVIVRSVKHVNQLRRALMARHAYREKNYIAKPKEDGYRGVHLVGKFPGEVAGSKHQIEIQLRTAVQHAWATAVEIIDLFTKQHLKANDGRPAWQDFFQAAGEALAFLDKTETDEKRHLEVCSEVFHLAKQLRVRQQLKLFNTSLKIFDKEEFKGKQGYYLMKVDTRDSTLHFNFFPKPAYEMAVNHYQVAESESLKNTDLVVALVSTDSITGLKEAYPNYFADSEVFVNHLGTIIARARVNQPDLITRFFLNLGWKAKP